ncbi:hypothetical protein DFH06DRAFT_1212992 [Mycena polygramma]|nr:hypothetical protein DFH06DRAFT_1212992 [Mycena polygramma]
MSFSLQLVCLPAEVLLIIVDFHELNLYNWIRGGASSNFHSQSPSSFFGLPTSSLLVSSPTFLLSQNYTHRISSVTEGEVRS